MIFFGTECLFKPGDIFISAGISKAAAWGINKVMAEIYALLYISKQPLSLEEMSDKLKTSRSNISINVRSLQDLVVVRKVVVRGDRRDYYAAEEDIIKVAKRLAVEKKKRELDPAIEIVEKAILAADDPDPATPNPAGDESYAYCADRLKSFLSLMLIVQGVFDSFIDGASRDSLPLEEINNLNL